MTNLIRSAALKVGHGGALLLLTIAWGWACGALHFVFHLPGLLALGLIPLLPVAWFVWRPRRRKILLAQACVTALAVIGMLLFVRASNDREWRLENRIQPTATTDAATGVVAVKGMRAFQWRTRSDYTPAWIDRAFQLADADSLDLIIEPLGDSNYFAHSMLSFGFGEGGHVVISVEVRCEKGERFGLLPGLYGQFELMYQVLDERDALTLRALDPRSHLYIYPVRATPEFIRHLFVDMLTEANSLAERPRFYHSLRANCTTKLFDHMNHVIDKPIKYRKEVLFPSMAVELLAEMGWLMSELPVDEAKREARSAARVRQFADAPDFSERIRER